MMVELLPPAEDARHAALINVLRHLEASGHPTPTVLFVEDENGSWRRHAARRPVGDRRRSIVAASSEGGLVDAVRLEIGGALWLPASTPAMEAACEAAASASHRRFVPCAGEDLVEMVVASATELRLVGWCPRLLWRRQLGRRLVDRLSLLAERLRCVPAILPFPVLLVADRSEAEVESAWREITDDGGVGSPGPPLVWDVPDAIGRPEPALSLTPVLEAMERERGREAGRKVPLQPVHELPSGCRVGWWTPDLSGEEPPGQGWLAAPRAPTAVGHIWQLGTGHADWETIIDGVDLEDAASAAMPLLRVPGWLAADIGRGTPAGLLIERLARDGRRAGRPLWVPNVGFEGVQFLLSLPAPIWVDGPGVPRAKD